MPATSNKVSDAGPILLIISIILTILAVATSILRLSVRYGRRILGWDDYTITATAALGLGRTIIQIVSVTRGNGQHRWNLSLKNYQYVNFLTWLTQLFLFPMLALLKISICLLVLRIKNQKKLRYFLTGVIVGLILTNLLPEIVLLAECSPVDAYWMAEEQDSHCWDSNVRIYSIYLQTAYSVTTDLLCSLLPIYVVWDLKMSFQKKSGICSLMSLGLVSTAFALLRASSLGLNTSDLSWEYCWTAIWADIECYIGIIAANLALSRMYYGWIRDTIRDRKGYTETRGGSSDNSTSYISAPTPYRHSNTRHSAQARGRTNARENSEKQSPFEGITREVKVEYTVSDAPTHAWGHDDLEAARAASTSEDTISVPAPTHQVLR